MELDSWLTNTRFRVVIEALLEKTVPRTRATRIVNIVTGSKVSGRCRSLLSSTNNQSCFGNDTEWSTWDQRSARRKIPDSGSEAAVLLSPRRGSIGPTGKHKCPPQNRSRPPYPHAHAITLSALCAFSRPVPQPALLSGRNHWIPTQLRSPARPAHEWPQVTPEERTAIEPQFWVGGHFVKLSVQDPSGNTELRVLNPASPFLRT
jgi:hypothetical protein